QKSKRIRGIADVVLVPISCEKPIDYISCPERILLTDFDNRVFVVIKPNLIATTMQLKIVTRELVALTAVSCASVFMFSCGPGSGNNATSDSKDTLGAISQPLVSHIYTADPSAHVFEGRIYIYPSHDIDAGVPEDDLGSHFDMKDYHVFSMDSVGGEITDHGVALDIKDIPWAGRQLWAPDAAFSNGKYYLYFPAKDKSDVFRIGVAVSDSPIGPFIPEQRPIEGSYSIDPAVFRDDDGKHYMYFGGIWGGQLQKWANGEYDPNGSNTEPTEGPALRPRVVLLADNMVSFAEPVREVDIVDENGQLLMSNDHDRRFFEAAWMHKYNGKYYLSYSTGDTHKICYAMGDSPYGPFTYGGVILNPVLGWTNHHSILEFN